MKFQKKSVYRNYILNLYLLHSIVLSDKFCNWEFERMENKTYPEVILNPLTEKYEIIKKGELLW